MISAKCFTMMEIKEIKRQLAFLISTLSNSKEFFEIPGDVKDEERVTRIQNKLLQLKGKADLKQEQKRNETSRARCVTMCVETKY